MPEPPGSTPVDDELSRLRVEKAQLEALLRAFPDISFVLDRHGRYIQVLGGTDRAMYSDGKILEGMNLGEVLPEETARLFREVIGRALDTGELQTIEYSLRVADVSALPEEERGSPEGQLDQWFQGRVVPLDDMGYPEPCVLWVAINITERKGLEQELRRLASTDELTGIANRRTVLEYARRQIDYCRRYEHPLALLALDIDHFKSINDDFDHATGDEVLRRMTVGCRAQLRQSDGFGRMGGEEFLVVLPETDRDDARVIGERLLRAVRSLDFDPDLPDLRVTVSVGGAVLAGSEDLGRLLARADRAMYAAKRAGRDRLVMVDPD